MRIFTKGIPQFKQGEKIMSASTLVRCACEHCNCSFESSQGYRYEGQLYCSQACATHDHAHPSPCCVASHCCQ